MKRLIAAGMLASLLHFADNTFAIDHYPEPAWITPFGVIVSWFIVTAIGIVALTRKRRDRVFYVTAGIYALILLSGLLHYAFGSAMHMALRSNVTVLAEAVIGAALGLSLMSRRRRDADRSAGKPEPKP